MAASEDQFRTLMGRSLKGDARAHEELLRSLSSVFGSYFGRRLRDAAFDVDDLVQESLIAIHTRRSTYDLSRPLMPWAYSIARYKLMDYFRRSGANAVLVDLDENEAAEEFEAAYNAGLDVDRLLAGLPPKQAMAIRATKLDGESISDVAAASGLTESDVKISVHRGLKSLASKAREAGEA